MLVKTGEKIAIKNYPYGFREKTTLYSWIEFSPKNGYRHVTQMVNPKTGKLNAPKKSTYSEFILQGLNEDGRIYKVHAGFNGREEINKGCKIVAANFALLTEKEVEFLALNLLMMLKVEWQAICIYAGADVEKMGEIIKPFIQIAVSIAKTGENRFAEIQLPIEEIEALKVPNFNPFTVKTYGV